mgnify:CR=1 FL=1
MIKLVTDTINLRLQIHPVNDPPLIAVTSDDQVNIIGCQIAKRKFKVNKTICRLTEESYSEDLEIFGEKGNIRWDFYTNSVSVFHGESRSRVIYEDFPKNFNEVYLDEMRHFFECCQDDIKPSASLDDGIHTMKLIAEAEKSAQRNSVMLL